MNNKPIVFVITPFGEDYLALYPSCSSASEIKEKNRKESAESREQLIQEGYVPCKRCNP